MKPRLQEVYENEVRKSMQEQFGYKNVMEMPQVTKVIINMGVGEGSQDKKHIQNAVEEVTLISGQKPLITKAKKSEAGFKIREGMPIGVKVTLRKQRMYEFLDRLTNIAMPRIRDFRGVSAKSFDGRGNYNLGLKEQIVFPEIAYDKADTVRGMNITVVTTAKSNEEAEALLRGLNFPFKKAA